MYRISYSIKVIPLFFVSILSFNVNAKNMDSYFGASYSSVNFNEISPTFNSGTPGSGSSYTSESYTPVDSDGVPVKLLLGVKLSSNYSMEFSYMNLGDFEYTYNFTYSNFGTDFNSVSQNEKYSGYGLGVTTVYNYNAGKNLKVTGKLGVLLAQVGSTRDDYLISDGQPDVQTVSSDDISESSIQLGVGISYSLDSQLSAYLEYSNYSEIVENVDMNSLTMGVNYYY